MDHTPVSCPEILLRAILKAGWIDEDTGEIKADAFIRHPVRDADGISVNVARMTDVPIWLSSFKTSYGADSLHTGRINTLGLKVVQTEEDRVSALAHALIVGLPSQEEDALAAERFASHLRNMSRPVDRIRRKQPR